MFQNWCSTTSCNGISDLYEARNSKPKFLFWCITMILMLILSVWCTYRTILGYIDTPSVTSVTTIDQPSLPMPEIAVCYRGGFNVSAMKNVANFSDNVIKTFQFAVNFGVSLSNVTEDSNMVRMYMDAHELTVVDLINKFAYSCTDVVLNIIRPGIFKNSQRCENVTNILTSSGNCYVFHSNGFQLFPGMWGGMYMELQIPKNSFISVYPELVFESQLNQEFTIALDTNLQHQDSKRSILIPANSRVEIMLNAKHYGRLYPGSKCSENPKHYTTNTCIFNCWSDEIKETFNCRPINVYENFTEHDGSNFVDACFPYLDFNTDLDYGKVVACHKKCLPNCDEWIYDPVASYSTLGNVITNGTRSSVTIAYNTMMFTKIQEVETFTIDMAIANVGGQSGLWLGASIVTIVHAIFYIFLGCCNRFAKLRGHLVSLKLENPK